MGAADIIPGVSGGTMALITGIYDRLIHAVRSVDLKAITLLLKLRPSASFQRLHWKFLGILLSGIVLAVIFFTRVVPLQRYMHTHPELVYGLFFGLILGSALVLLKEIREEKRSLSILFALLIGTLIGYQVVTLVPAATPNSPMFLFFSGLIAFCALILPGISGSYLLVILGKYDYVLSQLGSVGGSQTVSAIVSLLPLAVGGAVGLALFSRLISWLLHRYHSRTLAVLTGFLLGSLILIWPYQHREYEEVITRVETVSPDDPKIRELQDSSEMNDPLHYQRIVPGSSDDGRLRIEYVERSLTNTTPYLPGKSEDEDNAGPLIPGIAGMLFGLLLVGGLDRLRKK